MGGAIGNGAVDTGTGGAVGYNAYANVGGGAVGSDAKSHMGGGAVGLNATTDYGGAVGSDTVSYAGGAVGYNAKAGNGFSGGDSAKVAEDENAEGGYIDAVQLGTGTNNKPKTLQVYDYTMMEENGSIPTERLDNASKRAVFWYRETDGDNLLDFIVNLINMGYTSGNIQMAYKTGVPIDVPSFYSNREDLYALVKFTKHGFNVVEVTITEDYSRTTHYRKIKIEDDGTSNWLFDWYEIINKDGYLPLDGSVAMTGGITIGGGQARLSSNEYIATVNAYKDKNNPQDAYGSLWVHNGGAVGNMIEAVMKQSTDSTYTAYPLFGAHNKPYGYYVGNGDASARTIVSGGKGGAILVYAITSDNKKYLTLLMGVTGLCFSSEGLVKVFNANEVNVSFGESFSCVLTTTDPALNANGVGYNFIVL
jgi:hypothetical protein